MGVSIDNEGAAYSLGMLFRVDVVLWAYAKEASLSATIDTIGRSEGRHARVEEISVLVF